MHGMSAAEIIATADSPEFQGRNQNAAQKDVHGGHAWRPKLRWYRMAILPTPINTKISKYFKVLWTTNTSGCRVNFQLQGPPCGKSFN